MQPHGAQRAVGGHEGFAGQIRHIHQAVVLHLDLFGVDHHQRPIRHLRARGGQLIGDGLADAVHHGAQSRGGQRVAGLLGRHARDVRHGDGLAGDFRLALFIFGLHTHIF